jgi:hypothetical protein
LRVPCLAVVLGLIIVVNCSGTTSGPLDQGNDSGALCAPVASDGSLTVGIETLVNSANDPAVIDAVHLVEPRGVSIIESRVVTFAGGRDRGATLVGVVSGYPPEESDEWERSASAVNAEIPSREATDDVSNLVLGLQIDPDADNATASAIEVAYTVGGARYTYRTTNSIELVRGSC